MVTLDEITDEATGYSKATPHAYKSRNLDTEAIIDGLYGLAGCAYKPEGHQQLVNYLASALLDRTNDFTYNQTLNLLYALEMDNCELKTNCQARVNSLK